MTSSSDLERNIAAWTRTNAEYTNRSAPGAWAAEEIPMGIWGIPQRELAILGDVGGLDIVHSNGKWIELLPANGFEIERLIEICADENAQDHGYYAYVTREWAQRWPNEESWVARKRA